MADSKWYKRDPDAALTGFMGLNPEQRGIYCTLLELIYSKDDKLEDDDAFLSGWNQCHIRTYKRVKAELIEKGKIIIVDGYIRNVRASNTIARYMEVRSANSRAGKISAENRSMQLDLIPNKLESFGKVTPLSTESKNLPKEPSKDKKSQKSAEKTSTVVATVVSTIKNQNQNTTTDEGNWESELYKKLTETERPIVAKWNDLARRHKLARVVLWNEKRKKNLRARLKDYEADTIAQAIDMIPQRPFLMGEGNSGWLADFDWLLRPNSVASIIEGKKYVSAGKKSGWG